MLEEGSLTAHVTIVARAMGVPMLGRVKDVRHAIGGRRPAAADVPQASVIVRPTPAIRGSLRGQAERRPETARRIRRIARPATGIEGRPPRHTDDERGLRDDVGRSTRRVPTASACSAPNSSSSCRQRCRSAKGNKDCTRTCSTPRANVRSFSAPSTSAATRASVSARRDRGGGKPRDGLARAARRARTRHADEGAGARRCPKPRRAARSMSCPDGQRTWEFDAAHAISRRSACGCPNVASACRSPSAMGAMLEVPALAEVLDLAAEARFPVDRSPRPDAVPVRRRPRQSEALPNAMTG